MLPLPLARVPPDEDQSRRGAELAFGLGEGANQAIQALDRGEAADVQQDGATGELCDLRVLVVSAARRLVRQPAARLLDQHAVPDGGPVDLAWAEDVSVDAVGDGDDALGG